MPAKWSVSDRGWQHEHRLCFGLGRDLWPGLVPYSGQALEVEVACHALQRFCCDAVSRVVKTSLSRKVSKLRDWGCDTLVRTPRWVIRHLLPTGTNSFSCMRKGGAGLRVVPFGMLWMHWQSPSLPSAASVQAPSSPSQAGSAVWLLLLPALCSLLHPAPCNCTFLPEDSSVWMIWQFLLQYMHWFCWAGFVVLLL